MISRSFFYPDSPPPSELDLRPEEDPSPPNLPTASTFPPPPPPPPPPSTRHLDLLSLTSPVSSVVLDLDRYQPASEPAPLPLPLTSHNLASIAKRPSQRRRSRLPALLARFSSSGPACEPPPPASHRSHSRASLLPPAAGRYTDLRPRDDPGDQEPPSSLPSHSPNSSHVAQSQRAVNTPIPVPYSYTRKGSLNGRSLPADASETVTSTSSRHSFLPLSSLRHLHSVSEHDFGRKMHQTSSRLLRMTDDERPYTRVRPPPRN
jgi:hypothetical protein